MAALDPPFDGGGRGLFPYANGLINWSHPLAANLIFFAVPTSYGWFDLVRRFPMPHVTPTSSPLDPSDVQLFTDTPLGMAAWSYGNGNTNPRGAYAVTPIQASYQPASAMTVACGCWSYPYRGGYSGTANRLVSATSGTDNTGVLTIEAVNAATALVGGGGSTATTADGSININNAQVTHGLMAAYNGTTLCVERDGHLGANALATSKAWSGINQIRIGDPSNACGRPIFWAAAWNTALLTSGSGTVLSELATSGSADGAVARNVAFGAIPRGLVLARPLTVRCL